MLGTQKFPEVEEVVKNTVPFWRSRDTKTFNLVSLILFKSARRLVHCFSVHCRFVQIYASRGCPNHCPPTHVEAFDRLPARR